MTLASGRFLLKDNVTRDTVHGWALCMASLRTFTARIQLSFGEHVTCPLEQLASALPGDMAAAIYPCSAAGAAVA